MPDKTTYEDLEKRVKELEEALGCTGEERATIESKDHFRVMFEQAGDAILVHDLDGRFVNVNKQACDMLGYTREALLKMSVPAIDPHFSMPDDKALFWDDLSQSDPFTVARTYRRKDGSVFPVEICVSSAELDGKTYALTTARDVSERKQAERSLTSDIAHEINNILGIISGNAELALDDVPENTPVYSNLKEIQTAGLRARNVVKQLISNVRSVDYKREPISLTQIVQDAITCLRATIPPNIDIRKNIQTTSDTIMADPLQINQVIFSLGVNASRAMEGSGGTLEIHVQNVNLCDDSASIDPDLRPGSYVEVSVSDTGHGVYSVMMGHASDPSSIADREERDINMKRSVASGIVKGYGGAIVIGNNVDKGTTHHVYFPVVKDEPVTEAHTMVLPEGNEKILFVDDEKSIVDMARTMLGRLGYQVETEMNPVEALERFRSRPDFFDLLITDMTMPQMTGSTLVNKVQSIREDIPIILCTGYSEKISEAKTKALGIKAFVSKPFAMSDFAVTVRTVLDENRQEGLTYHR